MKVLPMTSSSSTAAAALASFSFRAAGSGRDGRRDRDTARDVRNERSCAPARRALRLAVWSLAAAMGLGAAGAQATPVAVDVSGVQSMDLLGDAGNTVWWIDVGAHAVLNRLSWSITLEAFSPSLLSEMQLSFGASSGLDQVSFTPGGGDFLSGTSRYTGMLDLGGLGLSVGADGLLRLEFSEAFKDFAPGVADGRWLGGTLTLDVTRASAVPEPASLALSLAGLAAMAGLGAVRRRASRHPD